MSWVDDFASVPDIESDIWSDIATLGLTLDKDDFIESGYALDKEKFPKTPGSQSTPGPTRPTTRSQSKVTPSRKKGKAVVDEEEEEEEEESEEEEEEEEEDPQEEELGLDAISTPGPTVSPMGHGSSGSSGLPTTAVGARTSGTPSSKTRPLKKKRKVESAFESVFASLAAVIAEQNRMNEAAAEDRRLAQIAQEEATRNLHVLTSAFAEEQKLNKEEQKLNREERKQTRDMIQDLMNWNPIPAIASAQPSSTSHQLLLENRPSRSNDSTMASPQTASAALPPLPSEPPTVDPLPPPPPPSQAPLVEAAPVDTVGTIKVERSDPQEVDSGYNLLGEQQEVVLQSGTDPAADPSAGCAR